MTVYALFNIAATCCCMQQEMKPKHHTRQGKVNRNIMDTRMYPVLIKSKTLYHFLGDAVLEVVINV